MEVMKLGTAQLPILLLPFKWGYGVFQMVTHCGYHLESTLVM